MMDLKSDLIPTLLGKVQFPSFSPNLAALESCTDEERLYDLLLWSMEREPYLLAKFVSRANSITYGVPGEQFYSPRDCLSRVGLAEGRHVALDFYLEDALGPYIRANSHCVATWTEARVAAQVSKHLAHLCEPDFRTGAAFLTTALSYVGELFTLGVATTSETRGVDLGLYAQPIAGRVDVFHITGVIVGKLELPHPVLRLFHEIREALAGATPFPLNASVVLLSRSLTQASQPGGVPVAQISETVFGAAVDILGLEKTDLSRLLDTATRARQQLD